MANVVITGGGGFLGARLARELLAAGSLAVAGGGEQPISRLTLLDRVQVPADLAADRRVTAIRGDLGELLDPADRGRPGSAGTAADMLRHGVADAPAGTAADGLTSAAGGRAARWPGPT